MRVTSTLTAGLGEELKIIAAREKHTISRMAAILLEQAIKERNRKKKSNGPEKDKSSNPE